MLIICTVNSEATHTIILVPKQVQHIASSVLSRITYCGYTARRVVSVVSLRVVISVQPHAHVNEAIPPVRKVPTTPVRELSAVVLFLRTGGSLTDAQGSTNRKCETYYSLVNYLQGHLTGRNGSHLHHSVSLDDNRRMRRLTIPRMVLAKQ